MAAVANWDWPPYRYMSLFCSSVNFLHHITVATGISPGTGLRTRTRLRVCEQAITVIVVRAIFGVRLV